MKLVKATIWREIFEKWKEREASNQGWVECATKVKGWLDWESLRGFTANQFGAEKRDWQLYRFDNPMEEVPAMLLGPYSSWQDRTQNTNQTTFAELLASQEQLDFFNNHSGVLSILNALPFETEMIGLLRKDNNKIVCIEGHHRATAIALAKKQETVIDFTNTSVTIALTELAVKDCHLIDAMLQRGTSKIKTLK
ncbi:MAG: hypothetical protein UT02_C0012G0024 [Parcubacteria group bacterium GW2011_GWC2_38_7]|nr:MAG: hypothetical protein UT02_C0012G0024 [Parcubacteria group bacterium GW2011_GWC2_38_7]